MFKTHLEYSKKTEPYLKCATVTSILRYDSEKKRQYNSKYRLAYNRVMYMTEVRKMNLGELNVLLVYSDNIFLVIIRNSRADVIQTI